MAFYKTFAKGFLKGQSKLFITSDFGKRKRNGEIESHNGIDIGVPVGTKLLAPLSGKIVKRAIEKRGAGLYVILRHWIDASVFIDIVFMHLNSVESYINVGKDISELQAIGTTGGAKNSPNSGSSDGPHLHLEIRNFGNTPVDPKFYFLAKERLETRTGKILNFGDPTFLSFGTEFLRTQTSYKYSAKNDITIPSETESKKTNLKIENNTIAKERLAPGIWQITKLLIDSSVEDKQIADSGISTQTGSLLNFFRKVCQEPLVQFFGDTFGNQYYWIVRKPPFDKEGFEKMIDLTMIELNANDIISSSLSWNTENIFSWYQYLPYADMLEIKETSLFMPAVFFPEYAAVWGSKPLVIESNYFNYDFSGRFNSDKTENKENVNRILQNAVSDLKYLIESNAYSPFTRRGTITIMGDRRIKHGTLIMYPVTGEVFYVDSVTNDYQVSVGSVTRTTTLTVSRGMFPAYIYGKDISFKTMSYFNLIDWGEGFDIKKVTFKNWKQIVSKWKVNLDAFGFFMSKQQMFYETINVEKGKKETEKQVIEVQPEEKKLRPYE